MSWFKELWNTFHSKSEVEAKYGKDIFKDKNKIGWNVYVSEDATRADYAKKFHKVHTSFKYKLLVPVMIIAQRFALPKYKHENSIEKNEYNREWAVFEKSYNDAMEDMVAIYPMVRNETVGISAEQAIKNLKVDRNDLRYLKTIKQGTLNIAMMDTYYHEFGVFLMHNIYRNMAKEFNGETYNRILYTSSVVNDVTWLIMQRRVREEVEITLTEAKLEDKK